MILNPDLKYKCYLSIDNIWNIFLLNSGKIISMSIFWCLYLYLDSDIINFNGIYMLCVSWIIITCYIMMMIQKIINKFTFILTHILLLCITLGFILILNMVIMGMKSILFKLNINIFMLMRLKNIYYYGILMLMMIISLLHPGLNAFMNLIVVLCLSINNRIIIIK